jgi:cyclopropane fatty-acyl-phospholipid synthase-like methyltransferase
MDNRDSFYTSLDINDERIIRFIPYLLQDLWSLGGNPDAAVELVKRNILAVSDFHVIDLGCGKGATIAELAENFPGYYEGVDIMPEFIEEGIRKVQEKNLTSKIELRTEDLTKTLKTDRKYDLVIYAYESDVLGTVSETITKLKNVTKDSGHIMLESAYRHPEYIGENYLTKSELYHEIDESGVETTDFIQWENEFVYSFNKKALRTIRQRVEDLKVSHPDLSEVFDDYYRNQVIDTEILNRYIECITFLLKPSE